jgi:hypothetical protein
MRFRMISSMPPKLLHLTGNSAMNASLYESQIILKYRRDKEVFFYTLI